MNLVTRFAGVMSFYFLLQVDQPTPATELRDMCGTVEGFPGVFLVTVGSMIWVIVG